MTFAVLLSLTACKPQSSPSPDQGPAPARSADQVTSFKLKIVFRGLIGFSQDSGKVRALLVNAQYDPATVGPDDLPPGVYHELGGDMNPRPANWLNKLRKTVPPHFAYISFSNAKVSGCAACDPRNDWRRPIFGADLHLKADSPGEGNIDLGKLATASSITKAREDLALELADLASLDQLDTSLIDPLQSASASIDHRLAARAEIEVGSGDVVSANLVPDGSGSIAKYSFNLPSEQGDCRGAIAKAQRLAEEVVITQQRVTGPVTLSLGPNDAITIEPINSAEPVVVSILNQTREVLDHSRLVMEHPHAHRWLYRLTDRAGQSLVAKHFFACRRGNEGPPDCPEKQFFVPKENRR